MTTTHDEIKALIPVRQAGAHAWHKGKASAICPYDAYDATPAEGGSWWSSPMAKQMVWNGGYNEAARANEVVLHSVGCIGY